MWFSAEVWRALVQWRSGRHVWPSNFHDTNIDFKMMFRYGLSRDDPKNNHGFKSGSCQDDPFWLESFQFMLVFVVCLNIFKGELR